jgi:hypothetical protein
VNGHPTVDLTSLPGAGLWLGRLRDDLYAGRSCLWLLPQAQVEQPHGTADGLLEELLHELGDFLLLPSTGLERPPARPDPAPVPPQETSQWSGLVTLLDFDDGMSDFGTPSRTATPPSPRELPPAPAAPVDALADILERLAKELPAPRERADSQPDAPNATGDVLGQLTASPDSPGQTRPIVIRAWREPIPTAATDLLRRLVATVKEAGLPPARRPRMLIVATAEDLPVDLPDQLSREDVAVHWWWGALGRLDTATVVSLARPRVARPAAHHQLLEAVAQATVVEVCGPFVDLAALLAARWDGRPETLLEELRLACADTVDPNALLPAHDRNASPAHRPEQALRNHWSTGGVDSWDGRLRRHPAHDLAQAHTVATCVWLAQNHALLPLLDDAREDFIGVVRRRSRLPLARLVDLYGPRPVGGPPALHGDAAAMDPLVGMELGDMWGAHLNSDIRLSEPERHRLRILWDARNRLAHRTPLDETRLQRLVRTLCA